MQNYRCKCGKMTGFGSMPFAPCEGCSDCNTTIEMHPSLHREPSPHQWETKYNSNTGIPYEVCSSCGKKNKNKI